MLLCAHQANWRSLYDYPEISLHVAAGLASVSVFFMFYLQIY